MLQMVLLNSDPGGFGVPRGNRHTRATPRHSRATPAPLPRHSRATPGTKYTSLPRHSRATPAPLPRHAAPRRASCGSPRSAISYQPWHQECQLATNFGAKSVD